MYPSQGAKSKPMGICRSVRVLGDPPAPIGRRASCGARLHHPRPPVGAQIAQAESPQRPPWRARNESPRCRYAVGRDRQKEILFAVNAPLRQGTVTWGTLATQRILEASPRLPFCLREPINLGVPWGQKPAESPDETLFRQLALPLRLRQLVLHTGGASVTQTTRFPHSVSAAHRRTFSRGEIK